MGAVVASCRRGGAALRHVPARRLGARPERPAPRRELGCARGGRGGGSGGCGTAPCSGRRAESWHAATAKGPAGSPGPGGREAAALGAAGPPPIARGPREAAGWCPAAERARLRYRGTCRGQRKEMLFLVTCSFFLSGARIKALFFLSKFAI